MSLWHRRSTQARVTYRPANFVLNTSSYPLRVNTQLDTKLSRWLWLVKWLLAISHYVILAFLWLAFFVVSVVAFFAILITGSLSDSS
jgi:hypothetical protein